MRLQSVYTEHHPNFGEGRFYADHGYVHYGVDNRRKRVFVHNIEVEAEHRGKGLGSALLDVVAMAYPDHAMDLGYTTDAGEALWQSWLKKQGKPLGRRTASLPAQTDHAAVEAHNVAATQMHDLIEPKQEKDTYWESDETKAKVREAHGAALAQFHGHIHRLAGESPPADDEYSGYRAARNHWTPAIQRALGRGDLKIHEAETRGYRGDQREHGVDGMGNSPAYGEDVGEDRHGGYQKYPQDTMYHTTNNVAGVQRSGGLKTTAQQHGGTARAGYTGLGGSADYVSTSTDKNLAHDIYHGLHEHHAFVHGKISTEDLYQHHLGGADAEKTREMTNSGNGDLEDKINRGVTTSSHPDMDDRDLTPEQKTRRDAPGLATQEEVDAKHDGGWRPKPGAQPISISGKGDLYPSHAWERPASEEEKHQQRSNYFRSFSYAREHHGGHRDPYFVNTNGHAFAQLNPANFAILHMHHDGKAQGFPQRANQQHHNGSDSGEWRTSDASGLSVAHEERPTPRWQVEQGLAKEGAIDWHPGQQQLFEDDHSSHLPNPVEGGHDWHHGTHKDLLSLKQEHPDPDEDGDYEPDNDRHWNSYLGDHWTSMRGVGESFAKAGYHHQHDSDKGQGNVFTANLGIKNPKVYGSETKMDSEAVNHAWGRYDTHDPAEVHKEHCDDDECYDPSEHNGDKVDQLMQLHYSNSHHAAHWLGTHPEKENIAWNFRRHLQNTGHDGIVYGNEVEGPSHHPCAVTFDHNQVHNVRRAGITGAPDHGGLFSRPHKPLEWMSNLYERQGEPYDRHQREFEEMRDKRASLDEPDFGYEDAIHSLHQVLKEHNPHLQTDYGDFADAMDSKVPHHAPGTFERDMDEHMKEGGKVPPLRRGRVPLTDLITNDSSMREVLNSGRRSETPDAPVYLKARDDMPGKYEIADGHHRVADAIRNGDSHVEADIDGPDDEPYEGPFYDFAQHKTSAWKPTERIFGPTKEGLDPLLFEGDHLKDSVRHVIMGMLDGYLSGLGFADWQNYLRVFFAGSESTFWWGNRDMDILLGCNYDALARSHPEFVGRTIQSVSDYFNDHFRTALNDESWEAPWDVGGELWHLTFYLNPLSWDIRDLRPYGAYSVTDDSWVVRPPSLPLHSADDFDQSVFTLAAKYGDRIRTIIAMPPGPQRSAQAKALLGFLHDDRHRAFSPRGHGWSDPGNLIWKYLDMHPDGLLQGLIAASKA